MDIDELNRRTIKILVFTTQVLTNVLIVTINKNLKLVGLGEIKFRNTHGRIRFLVGDNVEASVDERLAKIEAARSSLLDALTAVDELKNKAEENKADLEYLTKQIHAAEENKADLSEQLKTLKSISELDSEQVRTVLKLPTRLSIWTERVIAFLLGIAASILASIIYEQIQRYT